MTDKRTEKRAEKKSETLEVRLPHSKKEAFKAACEEEGITASHAVRTFIDAYLKRSRRVKLKRIAEDITMKLFRNPLKTAGIAGTGLIAAFLFGASPSLAEDDSFDLLDANADGILSQADSKLVADFLTSEEASQASTNGRLTRTQWETINATVVEIADTPDPDTPPKGPPILLIFIDAQSPTIELSKINPDTELRTWGNGIEPGQLSKIQIVDDGDSDPETFDMKITYENPESSE